MSVNNLSYWESETFYPDYDVIIIGAGIVGLFASLRLKYSRPGYRIAILERGILPSGASTKNAGFACFGSASELLENIKKHGELKVYELVKKRIKGLNLMRKTLTDEAISYESLGGYEVFLKDDWEEYNAVKKQLPYLNKLLYDLFEADIFTDASDKIAGFGFKGCIGLIKNNYEGQLNTGLMMETLLKKVQSEGIKVFTQCEVLKINGKRIETKIGDFKTSKIILATNAFSNNLLPSGAINPGRGQVLVTEPIKDLAFRGSFHYQKGYYYFRNVGNRILLGGGRNLDFLAEQTFEFGLTELVQSKLENLLTEAIYPENLVRIDYRWSGIMAFMEQFEPIIKKIENGVYLAAGCNGMGVALGGLTGNSVAELLINDDDAMFSP